MVARIRVKSVSSFFLKENKRFLLFFSPLHPDYVNVEVFQTREKFYSVTAYDKHNFFFLSLLS
jgi:hypothetical protein